MDKNLSIREALEQIQELYSKGVQSKDSRLVARYSYSVLCNNRSTVIKQRLNKGQKISEWCYQSMNLLLEKVTQPYTDTIALRTINTVPSPILDIGSSAMSNIYSMDRTTKFDMMDYKSIRYNSGKKYTATKPTAYVEEGYIYINGKINLKGIKVRDLFDDPIQAYMADSACDCKCKDVQDIIFPMDRDTLNAVIKMSVDQLVILFIQMKEDMSDDDKDTSSSNGQMVHQQQQQQQPE